MEFMEGLEVFYVEGGGRRGRPLPSFLVFLNDAVVGFVVKILSLVGLVNSEVAFVEVQPMGAQCVGGEIKYPLGIEGLVEEATFKMKMGTSGVASVATEAYHFTYFDLLVGFDVDFGEVAIESLESVGMADDNAVAVAAHTGGHADNATEGTVDGFADGESDVHTMVATLPPPTVIGGFGPFDWETEIITIGGEFENNLVGHHVDACASQWIDTVMRESCVT